MEELSGGKGRRSSWVERWLEFAVAVCEEDQDAIDEWREWAAQQLDDRDFGRFYNLLVYLVNG